MGHITRTRICGKEKLQRMGRKRKFSEEEIAGMQRMRDAGESVGDIARAYGTNARMVYEYTDSKTQMTPYGTRGMK